MRTKITVLLGGMVIAAVGLVTAAVVADSTPDCIWNRRQIGDEIFHGFSFEVRALDRGVHLRDVRLMMLGVVDLHGSSVNMWLEGVVGV